METDTARRQLIRWVWSGDGRAGRHQHSWGRGWGRVMGEGKVIQGECVEVAWNKTCKKLAFLGIAQEKECDEEYLGR